MDHIFISPEVLRVAIQGHAVPPQVRSRCDCSWSSTIARLPGVVATTPEAHNWGTARCAVPKATRCSSAIALACGIGLVAAQRHRIARLNAPLRMKMDLPDGRSSERPTFVWHAPVVALVLAGRPVLQEWPAIAMGSTSAQLGVERVHQIGVERTDPHLADQRPDVPLDMAAVGAQRRLLDVEKLQVLVEQLVESSRWSADCDARRPD